MKLSNSFFPAVALVLTSAGCTNGVVAPDPGNLQTIEILPPSCKIFHTVGEEKAGLPAAPADHFRLAVFVKGDGGNAFALRDCAQLGGGSDEAFLGGLETEKSFTSGGEAKAKALAEIAKARRACMGGDPPHAAAP